MKILLKIFHQLIEIEWKNSLEFKDNYLIIDNKNIQFSNNNYDIEDRGQFWTFKRYMLRSNYI